MLRWADERSLPLTQLLCRMNRSYCGKTQGCWSWLDKNVGWISAVCASSACVWPMKAWLFVQASLQTVTDGDTNINTSNYILQSFRLSNQPFWRSFWFFDWFNPSGTAAHSAINLFIHLDTFIFIYECENYSLTVAWIRCELYKLLVFLVPKMVHPVCLLLIFTLMYSKDFQSPPKALEQINQSHCTNIGHCQ